MKCFIICLLVLCIFISGCATTAEIDSKYVAECMKRENITVKECREEALCARGFNSYCEKEESD